jgi:hypothetical protein
VAGAFVGGVIVGYVMGRRKWNSKVIKYVKEVR